jgi:hypothetical protein
VVFREPVTHYRQPWASHLDYLFTATIAAGQSPRPCTNEIREARWFDTADPAVCPSNLTPETILALFILEQLGIGSDL